MKYTDSAGKTATKGYYYFAVTDKNYKWGLNYLPARDTGTTSNKIDLVFHRAKDYDNTSTTFDAFIDDVEAKMYNVYRQQAKIKLASNFDAFNFYVYSKAADVSDLDTNATHCGTVDSGANTDMPWRDVDAILHAATHGDCTIPALTQFTAEGSMTKAFLHESGHAVFKMADEYDAAPTCYTGYFQPTNEPNIFQSQAACQAEQTARQRNTNACRKFTTCQSGWWGIHGASDNTVMQRGDVGDPWGIEGGEHVDWFFTQY